MSAFHAGFGTGVSQSLLRIPTPTADGHPAPGNDGDAQRSNNYHGSLYEYNRITLFAANDWFNKASQVAAGLPNKPGSLIRNTFGARLGGPIKKDKLFFFINYEGQRTAENQQQNLTVPSEGLRAGNLTYRL